MKAQTITVSEHFYSIQGEGPTVGKPSIFLRLTSCNLMCGGQGTEKDGKLHNGATWRCDTIEEWIDGDSHQVQDFSYAFMKLYRKQLYEGAHIIITGGEPLLQQNACIQFITNIRKAIDNGLYVEVETNGTLRPSPTFSHLVNQYNVSPKLANSGMPKERRIKEQELSYFSKLHHPSVNFKFVINRKKDWQEIEHDFIIPYNIDAERIWLMPGSDSRADMVETWGITAEVAKKNGVNFSPRLQVAIWDQTTGV